MTPEEIAYKEIARLTNAVYIALGGLHIAVSELHKVDMRGKRNVGIWRMRSVERELRWAADRIVDLTVALKKQLDDGTE